MSAASPVYSVFMRHHGMACFSAAPAVLGAFVFAQFCARIRACIAHLRTSLAGHPVERRTPQDEIRGRVTDLNTVLQKPDVFGLRMTSTFFQAMLDMMQTDVVALCATVQALVILFTEVFVYIAHTVS